MSAWQRYKDRNGSTPLDLLNPKSERATDELAAERLEVCKACPDIIPVVNQCKRCGCFMDLKTKLKISKCPIGKW